MNSKRKDLQYASVFLLAVALTFLMGKGDNLWLVSWGDLIPSLFVLFIAGDCLHSSLLRIKRGEEEGGAGGVLVSLSWYSALFLWATCSLSATLLSINCGAKRNVINLFHRCLIVDSSS